MSAAVVPIVEGQSEVESVPVLLRRILEDRGVFRVKRNLVVKPNEIERAVKQAVRSRANAGSVLVLLDADDDCPAELGLSLLKRCEMVTDLPVAVVIAKSEFECWFLGAKESLRGVRGIGADAISPPKPEDIRGAKERLARNMEGKRRYIEVDDQPALAQSFDIEAARKRCPSLDKFIRDAEGLISKLQEDAQ